MKKIFKRCGSIWSSHLSAIIIVLILSLPLLSFIKNDMIFTVIAMLIYAGIMYSTGWNAGLRDSRNVGESVPDSPLAVKTALLSCLLPLLLLAVRIIAYHTCPTVWRPYGQGHEMIQTTAPFLLVSDIVYRLYNYYFISFMTGGTLISYIIPVIIPVILYVFGYRIGLTRFSVTEKYMPWLIYKPKKKKKNNV